MQSGRNDPRLERYLTSLEGALKPFPVSDRAEVVTEIKSHVVSALDRDPESGLDSILSALGEPETVANRYLLERGLKPTKTSVNPIVKWLVIGFLGTTAMALAFIGFLLIHFGSLMKVDGERERIQLFGGAIDINGGFGRESVRIGRDERAAFIGEEEIGSKPLLIRFGSGKLHVSTSDTTSLQWKCGGRGPAVQLARDPSAGATLDLTKIQQLNCDLEIPAEASLTVDGGNGEVDFDEPKFNVAMTLANGEVAFEEDDDSKYKFDLSVDVGQLDSFTSSSEANAKTIRIHVANGLITKSPITQSPITQSDER